MLKASAQQQEPMKILAIGNSFSEDALTYLPEIALASGADLDLYHLVIGGSSLEQHWRNAQRNTPVYTFIRKYENGFSKSEQTLEDGLRYTDYDYVVVQQVSGQSGIQESYEPFLSELIEYVRGFQADATLMIHQTWAYEKDSTHADFPRYDSDQGKMHQAVIEAVANVSQAHGLNIIPCGVAVHKARENERFDIEKGGVSLCRDGYHMSDTGRVLLGLVWNGIFTGKKAQDFVYNNDNVSESDMQILKNSADYAVDLYHGEWITEVSLTGKGTIQVLQNDAVRSDTVSLTVARRNGKTDMIALDLLAGIDTSIIGKHEQKFFYWNKQFTVMIDVLSHEKVDAMIENIASVVRFPNVNDIKLLLEEYEILTDAEKQGVTNYADLLALKQQYLDNDSDNKNGAGSGGKLSGGELAAIIGGSMGLLAVIAIISVALIKKKRKTI